MDVLAAIDRVRTVRAYTAGPIDPAVLRRIVDAGRHAGSSKNHQRWAFVTVTERATLERLGAVGRYGAHVPGAAAVIALVTPAMQPGDPLSIMWDLGRAAQNMVLAAWALGIGSCPVTVYEQPLVHEILGLPDDRHCEYLITLGHPADPTDLTRPPRPGGRVALDDILHDERW
ncbi:MAG: nitroreductase family protein [Chloroflexota bacterium]